MPDRISVTSADFIRNIGYWQNEAIRHPIYITHHGRARLILAAVDAVMGSAPSDAEVTALREALAAAHSLTATILDRTDEGFISFDEHLHVTAANRVADGFLCKSREMIVGASIVELLPSLPANTWTNYLQRVMRSRKADSFESEVHQSRVHVHAFPLGDGVAVLF